MSVVLKLLSGEGDSRPTWMMALRVVGVGEGVVGQKERCGTSIGIQATLSCSIRIALI